MTVLLCELQHYSLPDGLVKSSLASGKQLLFYILVPYATFALWRLPPYFSKHLTFWGALCNVAYGPPLLRVPDSYGPSLVPKSILLYCNSLQCGLCVMDFLLLQLLLLDFPPNPRPLFCSALLWRSPLHSPASLHFLDRPPSLCTRHWLLSFSWGWLSILASSFAISSSWFDPILVLISSWLTSIC